MPRLMNTWKPEDSSHDDIYDDHMSGFLNRCDLDNSSDEKSDHESDNRDNVRNNGDWSYKGLYYSEYLSEEDNYDKD